MIRGETSTGFAFEIDERITQDIRFVRICRKIYSEDTRKRGEGFDDLLNFFFPEGSDQEEKLFAHCERDGIISVESVYSELGEMMSALEKENATKK